MRESPLLVTGGDRELPIVTSGHGVFPLVQLAWLAVRSPTEAQHTLKVVTKPEIVNGYNHNDFEDSFLHELTGLPLVHGVVHHGVDAAVGHGQPVEGEVHVLCEPGLEPLYYFSKLYIYNVQYIIYHICVIISLQCLTFIISG